MSRNELERLISDYIAVPTEEGEKMLKDVFRKCLNMMIGAIREIKSRGLEVDDDIERRYDTLFMVYDMSDRRSDVELAPDSIEDDWSNVLVTLSDGFFTMDKKYLCDEFVKGKIDGLFESVKEKCRKDFESAKKRFDECSEKVSRADELDSGRLIAEVRRWSHKC